MKPHITTLFAAALFAGNAIAGQPVKKPESKKPEAPNPLSFFGFRFYRLSGDGVAGKKRGCEQGGDVWFHLVCHSVLVVLLSGEMARALRRAAPAAGFIRDCILTRTISPDSKTTNTL